MTVADFSRRGRASKRKGQAGENEVRDLLRKHGWEYARRNIASGGVGGSDLVEAIPDWAIEVKRTERLDLHGAWRQAVAAARPTDGIMIAHRGSQQPWMATITVNELMGLPTRPWSAQVLSQRQSVRAEFMARRRATDWPMVIHEVNGTACVTVELDTLLAVIREDIDRGTR
jgi:hypothetical protein